MKGTHIVEKCTAYAHHRSVDHTWLVKVIVDDVLGTR